MLSTLGHDLRTPLNSIIGYSELLQEELRDANQEDWVDDLEQIRMSGRQLLDLINRLVDLAKVEVGRVEFAPEPQVLSAALAEVVSAVTPEFEARGQYVLFDCAGDVGQVVADPARLRQCLSCAVQSIAELSGPGTVSIDVTTPATSPQVRVAIQMILDAPGSVASAAKAHGAALRSEDVGPPSARAQQQSHPSWSGARLHAGAQVGLLLARRLCELLGGSFQVQAGATIVLAFPSAEPLVRGGVENSTGGADEAVPQPLVAPSG
ncbi:uncharacterized protein CMC5_079250 [Chondromyces crocatus]|uniref:histidine kinase n=1 Tax=Chondromyces crocatus TaxID=52 RepID=A0A0K1ERY8_CHOCO|nr:uncharacterized protein CMC5_079250 [Chondromyces crocatus]